MVKVFNSLFIYIVYLFFYTYHIGILSIYHFIYLCIMYIYLCKVKDEPDSCKTDIEKKRGDAYKSALEVDSKLVLDAE